jgi:hypothetical protein
MQVHIQIDPKAVLGEKYAAAAKVVNVCLEQVDFAPIESFTDAVLAAHMQRLDKQLVQNSILTTGAPNPPWYEPLLQPI